MSMTFSNGRSLKLALLAGAMTLAGATGAAAQDVSVSTSIDYVTEYVFRGVSFENEAVQPGVEVALGDFSAGVWASTGLGSDSLADTDEVDFYAGYGFALSDLVSGSVGATWYHFPDGGDTFEGYVGLAFDTFLAPSITAYYDIELEAFTLEGGIGHSIATGENSTFDLGAVGGLVTADGGGDYEWLTLSASLGYSFTDDVGVYVGANYSLNTESLLDFDDITPDSNLFWFGTGISAGF